MRKSLAAVLVFTFSVFFSAAGAAYALPVVIAFEELAKGQTVAYDHYAGDGILFDSGTTWGIYDYSTYPNALYNVTDAFGDLEGTFTSPVSSLSIRLGDMGGDYDEARLWVWDSQGNTLDWYYADGNSWFDLYIDLPTASISRFHVYTKGTSVVYDTITFDNGLSVVPEPATLLLLGSGLLGLVGLRCKRK